MYFRFYRAIVIAELSYMLKGGERQYDLTMPRIIAKEENKSVFAVWLKMMKSLIATGCTFKEYYNLNFIKRTLKNQKTYITTGSNMDAYSKLNDKTFNHVFLNKDEFNETYSEFIARDWIKLSQDRNQIYSFFKKHKSVIIKPTDGDSGKGISIVRNSNELSESEIDGLICGNESGIAEELLYNHPKLNELNESSLNTMRIVTVRNGEKVDILFAGIRFGAKGSEIDNISVGGRIAPIDVESGKICGRSHTKKTVTADGENDDDHVGFEIPMWNDLNEYLCKLTAVVPEMRYMAWDIAVTERGFAAIEGNHSSGNTVIQAHLGYDQPGLKVRLNELISKMKK